MEGLINQPTSQTYWECLKWHENLYGEILNFAKFLIFLFNGTTVNSETKIMFNLPYLIIILEGINLLGPELEFRTFFFSLHTIMLTITLSKVL